MYTNEFGFAESRCKYTLNEFGEVADKFKRDYFGRELEDISCDLAEKEFWRLVTNLDDQCVVEYGADLHTNLVGSGFASRRNEQNQSPEYIDHPWNLNQLPLLEGSLFKYVNSNINGMIGKIIIFKDMDFKILIVICFLFHILISSPLDICRHVFQYFLLA